MPSVATHNSAPPMSEKAVMQQRVLRVREVVHNVSNNDIVLALHDHDMDVQRTIQALCEHGKEAVLDEWQGGAQGKKNKNKKAKAAAAAPVNGHATKPVTSNGHNGAVPHAQPLPPRNVIRTNGLSNGAPVSKAVSPPATAQTKRNPLPTPRYSVSSEIDSNDVATKRKAIATEVKKLARHDASVLAVRAHFDKECQMSETRIRHAMQELRQSLVDREATLCAQLSAARIQGSRFLDDRDTRGKQLHQRALTVDTMTENELNALRHDIKQFVHDKRQEEALGKDIRFSYEPDMANQMLREFGDVLPINGSQPIPRAMPTSPRAVNGGAPAAMPKPIAPPTKSTPAPMKPTASVESAGVSMNSGDMSAAELQAINDALQMSLQMSGITSTMLTSTSNTSSARRRGPPPKTAGGDAKVNGKGKK